VTVATPVDGSSVAVMIASFWCEPTAGPVNVARNAIFPDGLMTGPTTSL
jgi:hypothetical protein